MLRTRRQFASALGLLMLGWPVAAQTTVEAGPLFGYYRPVGSFDPAPVYSTALPAEPKDLSGAVWGGEVRIWLSPRLGVQVQVAAAESTIGPVYSPAGPLAAVSAWTSTGSVQVLYGLLASPHAQRVWVSAGPGVVRHGGEAYSQAGSQTDVATAAGLGGSMPLTGRLSATAGVTALFYAYHVPMPDALRMNGEFLQKGSQRDLVLHAGLSWSWH